MEIIKWLLLTILCFFLLFLESFLLKVFSFSLFIIIVISMKGRIKDSSLYIFTAIFSIVLDSVMHTPLGTHLLVLALLMLFYDFLNVVIPRDSAFNYVSIFLFIFLYYILLPTANSLLQDGSFPNMLALPWLSFFVNSVISVCICAVINHFLKYVREDSSAERIRLS